MVRARHRFRQAERLGGRTSRAYVDGEGEGGQRLFIIPALRLVIAMTAGLYGKEDQGIPPTRFLREVILESIR